MFKDLKYISTPDENIKFQAKLSSFADDTQLFFKDLESMKTAFTVLQTNAKASGVKINMKKN